VQVGEVVFSSELLVQTLIAGVVIGVLYALMALGITFIYSIVKMINWAMGEFYMIGGYLQYLLIVEWFGADSWWIAAPLSAAGVFVLGYLLEPLLIKPMFTAAIERRDEYAIVVTIALLLMLRNLAAALGGPHQRTPGTNLPTVMLGPLPESGARLAAFLCALAAIALFYLFLKQTWLGLAMRATAQSRVGAQTAGVNVLRLDQIAFGIGVGLAGLAGALLAPVFMVFPTSGVVTTVKGFEIIVIGGLGSIPGALIAGVLLGVVESLGAAFVAAPYQNVYGFLLVVLVLLVRPTGLFGERTRQA
jgi:branched-chain amino acid transport system permease protein